MGADCKDSLPNSSSPCENGVRLRCIAYTPVSNITLTRRQNALALFQDLAESVRVGGDAQFAAGQAADEQHTAKLTTRPHPEQGLAYRRRDNGRRVSQVGANTRHRAQKCRQQDFDDGIGNFFTGAKVVIDRAQRHLRPLGQLLDAERTEAALQQQLLRRRNRRSRVRSRLRMVIGFSPFVGCMGLYLKIIFEIFS